MIFLISASLVARITGVSLWCLALQFHYPEFQLPMVNCSPKILIFILTLSRQRDHIHLNFITVYCYNHSILLFVIADILYD
jgi:hypothetical protein